MSQIIKLKRNSTPGAVPDVTDLVPGEIAFNTGDGSIYALSADETEIGQLGGVINAGISGGQLVLYKTDGTNVTYAPFDDDVQITGNLELTNEDVNDNHLPELRLTRNSGASLKNDELGAIIFEGDNYVGDQKIFGRIAGFVDDQGDAASSGNVEGRIEFSVANGITTGLGGDSNNAVLETPTAIIDNEGITLPQATQNFYSLGRAENNGIRYWQAGASGFKTEITAISPTQDNELDFPNASGVLAVNGLAGGSLNGGNGLAGAARSSWDLSQAKANQSVSYYHYRDAAYGSAVDLVVSVPFPAYDGVAKGTFFKYVNISSDPNSDIIIDVDSYLAGSGSYAGTVYYALTPSAGGSPVLSTATNIGIGFNNFKVSPGGYIKLTVIDGSVYHVEGTNITMVSP